jgi:hypothetical protein
MASILRESPLDGAPLPEEITGGRPLNRRERRRELRLAEKEQRKTAERERKAADREKKAVARRSDTAIPSEDG